MQTLTVDVPTPDGNADAYLIRPDGEGPHPAVLVFMDAFGLRPALATIGQRIAAQGHLVLIPNLFHRHGRAPLIDLSGLGDPDQRGALFAQLTPMINALTPDALDRDTTAYLDFLAAQPGVAPGPAAIVGYCMGGTNALRATEAHPERIAATAVFHAGRLVTDTPDSPHLHVGRISGELYLGHADQDPSMTAEQITVLERALDAAETTYRSEVYTGAHHGFTQADTPMYDEQATDRHWAALFDLLTRTLSR